MHFRIHKIVPVISAAISVVSGRSLTSQRDKNSPEWMEALTDFKNLVHVVTFGDELPSHHSNPLQLLINNDPKDQYLFELPNGWFGKGRKNPINKKAPKKSHKKSKRSGRKAMAAKMQAMSSSALRQQQGNDDLALLNFLVQLEEPKNRLHVQSSRSKKHLESLVMAENRYKEIKKQLNQKAMKSIKARDEPSLVKTDPYKMKSAKKISKNHFTKGNEGDKKNKKKWYENINAGGAKNTLTLSAAFAVIVTALFCVVVQLFKLFAKPKGSSGSFDQLNRRSAYGYDRIALDMEDDDETSPLA